MSPLVPARHDDHPVCQAAITEREPAVGVYGPTGFADLYRRHYPPLVVALRVAGAGDPADLAQEAFARTLRHWRRVSQGTNPAGYVATVAFRLLRRRRPAAAAELAGGDGAVAGPEGAVVMAVGLQQALAAMPARRRACAALCFALEMSAEEAGEVLGIAAATVRVQLHRARADLRAVLTGR